MGKFKIHFEKAYKVQITTDNLKKETGLDFEKDIKPIMIDDWRKTQKAVVTKTIRGYIFHYYQSHQIFQVELTKNNITRTYEIEP